MADLGAAYHSGSMDELPAADVVIECTGVPAVIEDALRRTARSGITCLTGVSSGGPPSEPDLGALNRRIVLENDVIVGSVNANLTHYRAAVDALARRIRHGWRGSVTRRVPLDRWPEALEKQPDDVKVVIDLG